MKLESPLLADISGLAHGFFTRRGGVSTGIYASLNCGPGSEDVPTHVTENRARAAGRLGVAPDALCTLYQVHGAEVATVDESWEARGRPRADALVTRLPGRALGILTADCAPVLLVDPQARVIGAAHAGWRGLVAGVIEATLAAMEKLGARRARICAAIGPCIGQNSYEVGPEVVAAFTESEPAFAAFFRPSARPGHALFDLGGLAVESLRRAEVGRIDRLVCDTFAQADLLFSYRRARAAGEPDYGRCLSAIVLVPEAHEETP